MAASRSSVWLIVMAALGCGPAAPDAEQASDTRAESTSGASTGTTDTGTDGTGGSTETGEPAPEPYYLALKYIGGYNRLIIRKVDPAAGWCTTIQLVQSFEANPNDEPPPGVVISTPENFPVESIVLEPNLDNCDSPYPLSHGFEVSAAVGSVTWQADAFSFPDVIDVDVTLTIVQDEPWKPAQEVLQVQGLAVP
jgi:hypothetical protein